MTFFGRHFYTWSALLVSPDEKYEVFIMGFFRRFVAAHVKEVATGEIECMTLAQLEFFLKSQQPLT